MVVEELQIAGLDGRLPAFPGTSVGTAARARARARRSRGRQVSIHSLSSSHLAGRDPAAGHDHVHVGVVCHGRSPAMEHRGDADLGAQVLGIGRDGEHGLGAGLEQQAVDHALVLIGDVGDLAGEGKDHSGNSRAGRSSAWRASSQSLAAAPWHLGQCRLRQEL